MKILLILCASSFFAQANVIADDCPPNRDYGQFNHVSGCGNLVEGQGNVVTGNYNLVPGQGNYVSGTHNTVEGQRNRVCNDEQFVTGQNENHGCH